MKKLGKDDSTVVDPDIATHGGWRPLDNEIDLRGGINISIECDTTPGTYLAAMDNGRFTIGGPHLAGEGPNPEEILTLIKTPDDMLVSMKTGFGKYVGVDSEGNLIATADAVGTRERMIVVFEEGKTAIQSASNNLFLSMKPDREGYIRVTSRKAEADEMVKRSQLHHECNLSSVLYLQLRTDARKEGPVDWRSEEDRKSAAECETSYVYENVSAFESCYKRKYININLNDKESVRRAQQEGNLHELLLERRSTSCTLTRALFLVATELHQHPPSAWKKTALRTKSSSRITVLGVITERKNPQFLSWLKKIGDRNFAGYKFMKNQRACSPGHLSASQTCYCSTSFG
ncbi:Protein FRG1 [Dirofilaria immitis]|nr:Protein FRG1 [Dirofilaria immitis]